MAPYIKEGEPIEVLVRLTYVEGPRQYGVSALGEAIAEQLGAARHGRTSLLTLDENVDKTIFLVDVAVLDPASASVDEAIAAAERHAQLASAATTSIPHPKSAEQHAAAAQAWAAVALARKAPEPRWLGNPGVWPDPDARPSY